MKVSRKINLYIRLVSGVFFILVSLIACIENPAEIAAQSIDDAVQSITSEADDFQEILRRLEEQLDQIKGLEKEFGNDVADIATRSIAQAGVEFKCSADFVRDRVVEDLNRLKREILGKNTSPPQPKICTVEPAGGVDLGRVRDGEINNLIFYGYNFDPNNLPTIKSVSSGRSKEISSRYLSIPTHYQLSLNLSNMYRDGLFNDLALDRLEFLWKSGEVSTMNLNHPVCRRIRRSFEPQPITVVPKRTTGDSEFGGNGPWILTDTKLSISGNAIVINVVMDAQETGGGTKAHGERTVRVVTADAGFTINQIQGQTFIEKNYTDSDHEVDVFTGSGPIREFRFVGDTSGDDIGETRVTITFRPITYDQVETGICRP